MFDRSRGAPPDPEEILSRWWNPDDHTPRPELLGLSPAQTRALVHTDWNGSGPLSLREEVPIGLLRQSVVFSDLHVLLSSIAAHGAVPATSAGHFGRAFVDSLLEKLSWPGAEAEEVRREVPHILQEDGFRPLHNLRAHAQALDLIRVQEGCFQLTDLGHDLVRPERAGALYRCLVTRILGCPGWDNIMTGVFEETTNGVMDLPRVAPFVLWGLGQTPAEWRPAHGYAYTLMPPWTRELFAEQMGETFIVHIIKLAVFDLFERLGLAEQREYPGVEDLPFDPEAESSDVRRTALHDHVLCWEFDTMNNEQ